MTDSGLLRWPVDVIFRPRGLVSTRAAERVPGVRSAIIASIRLSTFYFANLVLYALPLTLAGIGITETGPAPATFTTIVAPLLRAPDAAWQVTMALAQNSAFLFVATALTFGTFHLGVFLTGSSAGVVRSLRTVSYSTGIYLAIIFTVVWVMATTPAIRVADDFLIYLQAEFIYAVIDLTGAELGLPGGRPAPVDLSQLTAIGQGLLVLLLLAAVYYLYVLYLGARVAHQATRFEAAVAVGCVILAPVLYVLGLIVVTVILG
ncbi:MULTISPECIES: hypothetical protein [Natrialbaceae]|uniref:hypothetical protein n=1 Tax=Natrialbaceae TaxID=1644061 RepID=UPI00207C3270|nr:hypothetical protein [Natronococcus sp. CG52]